MPGERNGVTPFGELKVFAGNASPDFAKRVCAYLGEPLGKLDITRFSNGEVNVHIGENVRGRDVFFIQTGCEPVNEHLVETLVALDAFRRASPARITLVTPHLPYARQDRKSAPHTPITAKLMANLITTAGADRVLSMDLHADQIQGFFDIPMDNLTANLLFAELFSERDTSDFVVVSPDAGGVKGVKKFADLMGLPMAIIHKHRPHANESTVEHIIGEVAGKKVIMVDDIIDTAGTVCHAAQALKDAGAKDIFVCATHAVLSGPAIERIEQSPITQVTVTDTVPLPKEKRLEKIYVASTARLFGEAIRRSHQSESISELFEPPKSRKISDF